MIDGSFCKQSQIWVVRQIPQSLGLISMPTPTVSNLLPCHTWWNNRFRQGRSTGATTRRRMLAGELVLTGTSRATTVQWKYLVSPVIKLRLTHVGQAGTMLPGHGQQGAPRLTCAGFLPKWCSCHTTKPLVLTSSCRKNRGERNTSDGTVRMSPPEPGTFGHLTWAPEMS